MSVSLPQLEDILTAVFLLIPGFISFIIARKLASTEVKFSDFETTVISIFLSIVNYVPFRLLIGAENLEDVRTAILDDPWKLGQLTGITIAIGLALGGVFKLIFKRGQSVGTLWNLTFKDAIKANRLDRGELWVSVITEKSEYMGQLAGYGQSVETEEREVLIKEPWLIKRDCEGKITYNERLSDETTYMLFTSPDIKRVTFYKELEDVRSGDRRLSDKIKPFKKFITDNNNNNFYVISTLAIIAMSLFVIIYLIIRLAEGQ